MLFRSIDRSAANTHIYWHGGHMLVYKEDALPYEIDPYTLDTIGGGFNYSGKFKSLTCSAHPKVDPVNGHMIAYGYLDERYPLADHQTVFGHVPGSAEMASAARPFTAELVTRLVARGVLIAPVTLHTGVSSQEAGEAPQPERFVVPAATADLVNLVRARGRRVVAVGTSATRALESAVVDGSPGVVSAASGWTTRVVTPGHPPQVVQGLVTGWHDPGASHLLLVEAVAGEALAQRAYGAATRGGYLWHEFGDSSLLLPALAGAPASGATRGIS